MSDPRPPAHARRRSQVLSWALWDFGATGVNAIVVTFVIEGVEHLDHPVFKAAVERGDQLRALRL